MPLSDRTHEAAERLVKRYPVARSALLPLLHLVQADQGHITEEGIAFCADKLGLTKAEVGAVSSFYTMYKREPVGDWLLSVCTNPTCKIAGANEIYHRYQDKLGGHHDADAGVTVEHAECLGICDAAPVVQVNYEMYGPLTQDGADDLLAKVMSGSPPPSNWSGEVPGTFREVEWDLSGAGDGTDQWLAPAAMAQVAASVPPSYRTGETDLPVTHPGGDPRGIGGRAFRDESGIGAPDPVTLARVGSAEGGGPDAGSDAGEEAAAADVAGEGMGMAEERADQAAGGGTKPPAPASEDTPDVSEDAADEAPASATDTGESSVGGDAADPAPTDQAPDQGNDTRAEG